MIEKKFLNQLKTKCSWSLTSFILFFFYEPVYALTTHETIIFIDIGKDGLHLYATF